MGEYQFFHFCPNHYLYSRSDNKFLSGGFSYLSSFTINMQFLIIKHRSRFPHLRYLCFYRYGPSNLRPCTHDLGLSGELLSWYMRRMLWHLILHTCMLYHTVRFTLFTSAIYIGVSRAAGRYFKICGQKKVCIIPNFYSEYQSRAISIKLVSLTPWVPSMTNLQVKTE